MTFSLLRPLLLRSVPERLSGALRTLRCVTCTSFRSFLTRLLRLRSGLTDGARFLRSVGPLRTVRLTSASESRIKNQYDPPAPNTRTASKASKAFCFFCSSTTVTSLEAVWRFDAFSNHTPKVSTANSHPSIPPSVLARPMCNDRFYLPIRLDAQRLLLVSCFLICMLILKTCQTNRTSTLIWSIALSVHRTCELPRLYCGPGAHSSGRQVVLDCHVSGDSTQAKGLWIAAPASM